jgi:hypothetical protein
MIEPWKLWANNPLVSCHQAFKPPLHSVAAPVLDRTDVEVLCRTAEPGTVSYFGVRK